MVDKLPDLRKKSAYEKPIEKDSPYYQQFKSRGLLYVFNPVEANIDKLLKGMKGLGFVQKSCSSRQRLEDRIKSDIKSNTKYKEDYCVAVLTVTRSKLKNENQLIKNFHSDSCPNLVCKPKLFFFLTVSEEYCGEEVTDGVYEYVLAHEADLFIYKDTSGEAVKDLTTFVERLNQDNQDGLYVPDELTSHLRLINRPNNKMPKYLDGYKSMMSKAKPTIHDSLTRRLMLGPKDIVIDKKDLNNKNINRRILSAITFIYDDIDLNEILLDGVNLEDLKSKIERNRNCHIPDGKRILKELELIIEKNTKDDQ